MIINTMDVQRCNTTMYLATYSKNCDCHGLTLIMMLILSETFEKRLKIFTTAGRE